MKLAKQRVVGPSSRSMTRFAKACARAGRGAEEMARSLGDVTAALRLVHMHVMLLRVARDIREGSQKRSGRC